MKKFKCLSLICLSLLACLTFAACGFGSYDLQFLLPDGTVFKTHTYGPGGKLTSVVSAPNVMGYNFVGWSPSEDLEYVITVPYSINSNKLYAKYEIDEDIFFSYSTINYNGGSTSLNVDQSLQNYYLILVDNTTNGDISKINITSNNSSFTIQSLTVRNENAKILEDNNANLSVFSTSEQTKNCRLVLEINAVINGNFTITVE